MSHYGQDNDKQASSLMDGVPVKISEKYKPPRKITLPVGYQNRVPLASVDEVYDFSLENTVLRKIAEWRKLQEQLVSRRRENIKQHNAEKKDDGAGYGALSKSVPDIMKELDRELKEKRRGPTPPTVMSSRPASLGSTGLENWKPWPDLDSPDQSAALKTTNKEKCACPLPNPFAELSVEEQNLAIHISEMGFPLPRTARACQLVGSDDKKMVEFLLLVQALEERGYPGDRAERALTVNECDLKEAERCLEATTQLLDLGFPEDRVAEALAKCNNDRDQALEHLIS
ncbi:ubiquitin-associated protein 1-like isoform X2 [Schistocerca gregaria]|uniref:ubiquitin-associated protein 1-like isoform X2 n=1 Tax=Schistocerca gregaria TaxID=7010 RepID=UPI00211E4A74|nr:ubiquitin-associated protein 1-like isoform X2 [Schistocerca gregaria]